MFWSYLFYIDRITNSDHMINNPKNPFICALLAAFLTSSCALTQAQPQAAAATVNGSMIPKIWLDQVVQLNVNAEQADTPELRRVLLEELISRELVAQDALKKKIDTTPEAKRQLHQAQQSVLVDLAVADYLEKNPIDEAALRSEYHRQLQALKAMGASQQYQLRLLVLPTEALAREAMRNINMGMSMDNLIRQSSVDASRDSDGLLDWLLPSQMLPSIGNVVVNLSLGQMVAAPIETAGGWNVLRVENVRPYTPPRFEDTQVQLRTSLLQQRRAAYVAQLRAAARVEVPQ